MRAAIKYTALFLLILISTAAAAGDTENRKDSKALDVLNQMAAYTASIDQGMIKAEIFADARLDAGLIVSNPSEVIIKFDRPGSLYMEGFDGVNTRKIYIHEGNLTVFSSETNFYAQTRVPEKIEDAMQFAMEELDLDLELGELFFADSTIEIVADQDTILYLTDKSRIHGVDCHHIAVRGDEMDLQLWVEEGAQPAPRKILMTMKWEGGSPRHAALMKWGKVDGFDPKTFVFAPPEGAQKIRFAGHE